MATKQEEFAAMIALKGGVFYRANTAEEVVSLLLKEIP